MGCGNGSGSRRNQAPEGSAKLARIRRCRRIGGPADRRVETRMPNGNENAAHEADEERRRLRRRRHASAEIECRRGKFRPATGSRLSDHCECGNPIMYIMSFCLHGPAPEGTARERNWRSGPGWAGRRRARANARASTRLGAGPISRRRTGRVPDAITYPDVPTRMDANRRMRDIGCETSDATADVRLHDRRSSFRPMTDWAAEHSSTEGRSPPRPCFMDNHCYP